MTRAVIVLIVLAMVAAACGGGEDDAATTTTTAPATTTTAEPATTTSAAATTTTIEAVGESSGDGGETTTTTSEPASPEPPPEALEDPDLLTFARGVLFVEQTGLGSGSAGKLLRMIDGDPLILGLSTDDDPPVVATFKMPADTTFTRFAIPGVFDRPGNATFMKMVTIEGSLEGPDSGFEVLAEFDLELHEEDDEVTEIFPESPRPVRWVRITWEGGVFIEEGDEGRTILDFTELIGNGTQEPMELSNAFDGVWSYRLTERLDLSGHPLELRQVGATVTGCLDTMLLTGTVNGRIARLNGFDPTDDDVGRFIMVADDDGAISSVYSLNNSIFGAWTAVDDPETTETPCSEEAPQPPAACGTAVYINFDYNSADIRPESEQVLADLYANLLNDGVAMVSIEGHTSTEGSEGYNLDLSERRAQSVVDDLVARGYDAGAISAIGLGETMPLISPDDDETSRELNRRVEINCG